MLNRPDIIWTLLSKLPGSVKDKWSRRVLTIRRRGNREPEMGDFIQFVNNETLIVIDPVFSKEAVEQYVEKKPYYKKVTISAFPTGNEENPEVYIYCNERHKLQGYNSFIDQTLKQRIKFLPNQ